MCGQCCLETNAPHFPCLLFIMVHQSPSSGGHMWNASGSDVDDFIFSSDITERPNSCNCLCTDLKSGVYKSDIA